MMTEEDKKRDELETSLPTFDFSSFNRQYKAGEKPLMDALMSSYTKPEMTITREQEKKARTASAITDGLVSLAEILGHAGGVKIRDRSRQKTNQQLTTDRLEALKDKYEQDMLRYNVMRGNAMEKDFAHQMKVEMQKLDHNRQEEITRQENARRDKEIAQKREWQLEDEERKIKQAQDNALWEHDNIYAPKLELQDKYDARKVNRRAAPSTQASKDDTKNLYEISVPDGTPGAEYDQHTGNWYITENLTPARQQSIISKLPGGKTEYIDANNLYREQMSTNAYGETRITQVPFSDTEIVKHYLENGYRDISPQWRTNRQPMQPTQTRGNIR